MTEIELKDNTYRYSKRYILWNEIEQTLYESNDKNEWNLCEVKDEDTGLWKRAESNRPATK